MPTKVFKVNIYEVEAGNGKNKLPLEFSAAMVAARIRPLWEREVRVRGKIRRLEQYKGDNNNVFVNLTTSNYEGPGTMRLGQPTAHFQLTSDQFFAPETAMLYDVANNIAFVESTVSMGPGAIADYFERFTNDDGTHYMLTPIADVDAAVRARGYQTIRFAKLRMAMGPMTDSDRAAGMGPIQGFGTDLGAGHVDIVVSAERPRDRSLSLAGVVRMIENLTGRNVNNNSVSQFIIRGKEHEDEPLETIDLIQHREHREVNLEIDPTSRKVPHGVRWDALLNVQANYRR